MTRTTRISRLLHHRWALPALLALIVGTLAIGCGGAGSSAAVPVSPEAGTVTDIVMARSVDASGNPVDATNVFRSAEDRMVHAVVLLEGAHQNDEISYVRYYNGTYVDSGTRVLNRQGLKQLDIVWSKQGDARYPTGAYALRVYYNGEFKREVTFHVE